MCLLTVDTKKRRQKKAILRHWLFQASVIKVVQYEVKLVLSLIKEVLFLLFK